MNTCYLCRHRLFQTVRVQKNGWVIAKCRSCGFVQISPRPSSRQVAALYEHDWKHFDPYRSAEAVHRHYFKKILEQQIFQKRPLKILDIGCATGIFLEEAKKNNIDAVGIDISTDAVKYCKKQKLQAYEGTASSYAKIQKPHTFDVITAFEVIEHELDPFQFLGAVRRILKPGGTILITTPNFNSIWRTLMGPLWVGYQHPEHLWFFTPETMMRLMRSVDFSSVTITRDANRPYSVSYAFRRLSDYFPFMRTVFDSCSKISGNLPVPINPWGDMIVQISNIIRQPVDQISKIK